MKKLLLPLLSVLFVTACQKQISKEQVAPQAAKENSGTALKGGNKNKIDVCHKAGPNNWQTINISINALPAHLAHGDVRLDDQDRDGYVLNNECGLGPMGDCDDNNPAINPATVWFKDKDNDGYSDGSSLTQCVQPADYKLAAHLIATSGDCNDNNAAINPGATELCANGIDDNCNGQTDENCFVIGTDYQGGKIAYIFQPGDPGYVQGETHGLIAAPSDQSTGAEWGCFLDEISGADGTAIGTGNQNTIDIMNGCATAGIAARICGDLVLSGYGDWYLPSKDELNKLYINRVAIGGFANISYWSSSEGGGGGQFANIQSFVDGTQYQSFKFFTNRGLRAVRSF